MTTPVTVSAADFQVNQACLGELMGMGFDQETATQALFFSGNNSTDVAVSWIFDNQGQSPRIEAAFPAIGAAGGVGNWEGGGFDITDEECKMVIVINSALHMSAGKVAAQAAHAAIGVYRACAEDESQFRSVLTKWEQEGEVTIVLSGENAPHLEALERRAKDRGIMALLISDAGRTQVAQGAKTALCIFGDKIKVDAITGNLRPL